MELALMGQGGSELVAIRQPTLEGTLLHEYS